MINTEHTSYLRAQQWWQTYGMFSVSSHEDFVPRLPFYVNRAMMRNETVFPEPYKFIPERFLGRMHEEAAMQVDSVFGFGRR